MTRAKVNRAGRPASKLCTAVAFRSDQAIIAWAEDCGVRCLTHCDARRARQAGEAPAGQADCTRSKIVYSVTVIISAVKRHDEARRGSVQHCMLVESQMSEKYIKPAVVAAGALMMLLGVYELAGWWGLLTALGATLLLFGALS